MTSLATMAHQRRCRWYRRFKVFLGLELTSRQQSALQIMQSREDEIGSLNRQSGSDSTRSTKRL